MTVHVGLIGVGGMGQAHIKALARLENVRIVSVCDSNLELVRSTAASLNAAAFVDYRDVLKAGGIDALFVCTPPFVRGDIEIEVAHLGIDLFVEKPLGLDLETVSRKQKTIAESGIIHSSGYCLRYLDTIHRVKSYLVGKDVDFITGHRNEAVSKPAWWKKAELSGGQFVTQTTHQVDLIRFLVGEIAEVSAMFGRRSINRLFPDATIYDVGTVSMKLQSGAIASVSNTCLAAYRSRRELEIIGAGFQVFIDNNGTRVRIMDDVQDVTFDSRNNFLFEQDEAFIKAVETRDQSRILCSYSDAARTLAVTLAANESAETGRPVALQA